MEFEKTAQTHFYFQTTGTVGASPTAQLMHFLIADDHVDSATILGMAFQAYLPGSTVDVVNDGIAALKSAIRKRPDVAILDLHLPHLSGLQVAYEMRNFFHTDAPRLIAISADVQLLHRIGVVGPFHHLLPKPCGIDQLMLLIQQ